MAKNVLELNGKRYDAITGAFLGESTTTAAPAAGKPGKQPSKGRAIDGFIRPTGTNAHTVQPAKPKPAKPVVAQAKPVVAPKAVAQAAPAKPARTAAPPAKAMHATVKAAPKEPAAAIASKPRAVPAAPIAAKATTPAVAVVSESQAHKIPVHAKGHKPEKSKTLMRRAVHKPEINMKPSIKPQAPAEIAPKDASALAPKPSVLQIDEDRLERAKGVHMSKGIRHFQPVRPDYTPEAMEAMPRTAAHIVPAISVRQAPAIQPNQHQDTDIFEAALARAESHKQPAHHPHKKHTKHRGMINVMAGVAAFLVIAGFIGYVNMPNIQLHIASVQAGFTASMPGYRPDGYAMKGGVQRIGNTVSMRFMAGENNYTVTQQPSDWNSQTLIDNTVALSTGTYKTVQAGGRNIYVYGGSNAVWVDGGVRYDLNTNAQLSTEDITQLAASL